MSGGYSRISFRRASGEPPDIDATVAHNARVYDYWLGGKDNFAADRGSRSGARTAAASR